MIEDSYYELTANQGIITDVKRDHRETETITDFISKEYIRKKAKIKLKHFSR